MYPEGILINKSINHIVVFERDINNPQHEGFISFWEIRDNNKELIYKKRLMREKAIHQWLHPLKNKWEKLNDFKEVA